MNTIKYKEYIGTVEYSDEDACLFGRVVGINDSISYEGQSVDELRMAFQEAVDDYLAYCKKEGKTPNKTYSGRFMLRINPAVHARLAMQAQVSGKSLNQYAIDILEHAR